MADELRKFICADCGKQDEVPEKLALYMEKKYGRVLCKTCSYKAYQEATSGTKKTNTAKDDNERDKKGVSKKAMLIAPKHFKAVYDEFVAEFGEEMFKTLGSGAMPWITTVILSREKNGVLG